MSSKKCINQRRDKYLVRLLCCVMIAVMAAAVLILPDAMVRADENTGAVGVTATATNAEKSGIVKDSDGFFRYYENGAARTTEGWLMDVQGTDIYIDGEGHVTKAYSIADTTLTVYGNGNETTVKSEAHVLSDGYAYLFGEDGRKVMNEGWNICGSTRYKLDASGRTTMRCVRTGDVIRFYTYNKESQKWQAYMSRWVSIGTIDYYANASGVCSKYYNSESRTARVLGSNNKFALAKRRIVSLKDGKTYYFNSNAVKVSKKGWYTTDSNADVYVSSVGYVSYKIQRVGHAYRMYGSTNEGKAWTAKSATWIKTGKKLYYFSKSGAATVVYNLSTKELYRYSSTVKGYKLAKNTLDKLNGSRYYFYNSRGRRVTANGWKSAGKTTKYYVNSHGYVSLKYVDSNGVKRIYSYDYKKNKWVQKKSLWRFVGNNIYYFNSKGIATTSYDSANKRVYVYSNKKWRSVKSAIVKVNSSNYYFDSNGKRVTKAGVYKTADGYLAYVNSRGIVYKKGYDLSVKRYYTIDIGNGRTAKVYGYYDLDAAQRLMKQVNEYRESNGLAALTISTSLTETAETRAKEASYLSGHYRPNGTLCLNSMDELYGENLARGYDDEDKAFRAWTKSTDHDRNMLDTSTYKTMGAAVFIALDNDNVGFKTYYVLTFGK